MVVQPLPRPRLEGCRLKLGTPRRRVSSPILSARLRRTFETVIGETPARAATWRMEDRISLI